VLVVIWGVPVSCALDVCESSVARADVLHAACGHAMVRRMAEMAGNPKCSHMESRLPAACVVLLPSKLHSLRFVPRKRELKIRQQQQQHLVRVNC
jgi:hypothetical protein